MRNHGQNASPAAQIGVRWQRQGQRRRGGGAVAAVGGGAGNGRVGGGRLLFLRRLLLTRDGKSGWTPLHIAVCNRDSVTMLLLLGHGALADGNGCG